jgi:hypothetical protein
VRLAEYELGIHSVRKSGIMREIQRNQKGGQLEVDVRKRDRLPSSTKKWTSNSIAVF